MIFLRRAAIIIFIFFLPVIVFARDIEVLVEDEDLAMPLEGAVVSARGGKQYACDANGIARVNLPDDRQTVVTITYPGYETLRLTIPAATGDGVERFTAELRLGGVMTSQELVLEAERPDTSETKSGRSVAISDRDLARTAEIGIVEDVMSSVKLLPGVGYTGMFGAMPSIRGGDPGDLMTAFDGFYLELPYHWGGAISIFDPKMVTSARLSHGVFSARYGHTISGLLEIASKSPSNTQTQLEAALGTSAASFNLSVPLFGKGGVLFMGKVTYWDTFIWAAKQLSKVIDSENLAMVNAITTAPYIRSFGVASNYRFTPNTEGRLNAFFGSDGVGANYQNIYDRDGIDGSMDLNADYFNYQGFLIAGVNTSPVSQLALRFTGGVGFTGLITDDSMRNNLIVQYNDDFWKDLDKYYTDPINPFDPSTWPPSLIYRRGATEYKAPGANLDIDMDRRVFNAQARADADWDFGKGFIAAIGVQELYSMWIQKGNIDMGALEIRIPENDPTDPDKYNKFIDGLNSRPDTQAFVPIIEYFSKIPRMAILIPRDYRLNVYNQGFTTSAYGLVEYTSPNNRFGAELGLRVDHLYFLGKGFVKQTNPALNPRLNIDFNILKDKGSLDSLALTLGTGLFSSIDKFISFMDKNFTTFDSNIKFNRSWTSIAGVKLDMMQGYSFNIEGYYKRIFDRAYITADTADTTVDSILPGFKFDGVGNVWGFDLQLQKLESRYFDGWISYTFTWAKYMDPSGSEQGISNGSTNTNGESWYYPSFHRFHYFNLVMNVKPFQWFHISLRFGFASGTPRNMVSDEIKSYPVFLIDDDGNPVILQKYGRESWYDENNRSAWSFPLDLKFSFFIPNKRGRSSLEIYLAGENLMAFFYSPEGNTRFNQWTGKEDTAGTGTSGFDLPVPMASFGFKWRY